MSVTSFAIIIMYILERLINEGDTVTIWFDGNVEETEPAQIGFAYRIEKVME